MFIEILILCQFTNFKLNFISVSFIFSKSRFKVLHKSRLYLHKRNGYFIDPSRCIALWQLHHLVWCNKELENNILMHSWEYATWTHLNFYQTLMNMYTGIKILPFNIQILAFRMGPCNYLKTWKRISLMGNTLGNRAFIYLELTLEFLIRIAISEKYFSPNFFITYQFFHAEHF